MIIVAAALSLWALSDVAFTADDAILPVDFTCEAASEAERSIGAKGIDDGSPDARSSFAFYRKFRGDDASIVHLCNGAEVVARLIYMRFATRQAANLAFTRHHAALVDLLGAPCWDPDALSDEQRARLPDGDLSALGWFRHRVEWNARPGLNASLTLSEIKDTAVRWQVTVATNSLAWSSSGGLKGIVGELYDMSSCEKGSLE